MTIDPDRLTALIWRALLAAVVGWVLSAGVVGWVAYRTGYSAGLEAGAGLVWS